MKRKREKMIISKTVCDVPDQDGQQLFGRLICGKPAIAIGHLLVSVMYGKDGVHICATHAGLPLDQLLKLVYNDHDIGPSDDSQR